MTDIQTEFSFSSEGIEENSQTEESKFPQSKRTIKKEILRISTWYLWIKQEKREVYSWPESKRL